MDVEESLTKASPSREDSASSRPCIILFYKYHPLSDDPSVVELYRAALENVCVSLSLRGRILVGCSKHRSEGINGTLSGTKANLLAFVEAFCPHNKKTADEEDATETANAKCPATARVKEALAKFRIDCQAFYKAASCSPVEMEESEFKWSELETGTHSDDNSNAMQEETKKTKTEELFPDLNIKIVNELIGTGGVLSSIQIDDLHKGYLTPQEWHERITKLQAKKGRADENNNDDDDDDNDTILIDCRNTKECAIGNFVGSVDPKTTTFNQFPKWVDDHKHKLRNKNVLMYCTGGIRCEKASAYVRQAMGSSVKEVRHLQGGIHKYLEAYGGTADTTEGKGSSVTAPLWRGKNFVFDGRGAHGPGDHSAVDSNSNSTDTSNAAAGIASTGAATKTVAVGACRYCEAPYDSFDPHCVCTVCKEPILVCPTCQQGSASQPLHPAEPPHKTAHFPQHYREYHCSTHKHLENCYFTNLQGFSSEELTQQLTELEGFAKDISVGKKFRQRRKTLAKQRVKIEARLQEMGAAGEAGCSSSSNNHSNTTRDGIELKCRNCGQIGCSGKCWGFHGLKRKRLLEQKDDKHKQSRKETRMGSISSTKASAKNKHNERLKQQKELQKQKQIEEWIASGLTQGPAVGRDPITGLRVPKPCVRVLETTTKGKWCGRSLLQVLKTEFPNSLPARSPRREEHSPSISAESQVEKMLQTLMRKDLIRVNGNPIQSLDKANAYKLKNMDIIDRIVLWHEPPIHLPSERIQVQKIPIPEAFLPAGKAKNETDAVSFDNHIYVCNKPSTVPVHPAGPYLSNSLTMLVEAQEGLRPKTLIPCHRIDRVTSGMTICCADSRVARLIQTTMAQKAKSSGNMSHPSISKQYLARVMGRFPAKESDDAIAALPSLSDDGIAQWEWLSNEHEKMIPCDEFNSNTAAAIIKVDAPIETVDPLNGIRKITSKGKSSTSLFRLLKYDADTDNSIIACVPVTGRSHQLRVHLEWIGHSIVNDAQYGGISVEPGISKTTAIDPSAGTQRIVENIREYKERAETASAEFTSSSITQEQAQAAREVCPTCDLNTAGRGPSLTFSPAQLLQCGHAICLHAYRYNLAFFAKEKLKHAINNNNNEEMNPVQGDKEKLFRIDLKVDLPPWASHQHTT